jgi:hypothetical protein
MMTNESDSLGQMKRRCKGRLLTYFNNNGGDINPLFTALDTIDKEEDQQNLPRSLRRKPGHRHTTEVGNIVGRFRSNLHVHNYITTQSGLHMPSDAKLDNWINDISSFCSAPTVFDKLDKFLFENAQSFLEPPSATSMDVTAATTKTSMDVTAMDDEQADIPSVTSVTTAAVAAVAAAASTDAPSLPSVSCMMDTWMSDLTDVTAPAKLSQTKTVDEPLDIDRFEKEKYDKEQYDRAHRYIERADKERADKERAVKERADKERADKERADKERAYKEQERADYERLANKSSKPAPKKKNAIPKAVKQDVWNLYIGAHIMEHRCLCCKKTYIKNNQFHCGHVVAEKCGGSLEISNLRPICSSCNYSMGTEDMIEYIKKYGYYI